MQQLNTCMEHARHLTLANTVVLAKFDIIHTTNCPNTDSSCLHIP